MTRLYNLYEAYFAEKITAEELENELRKLSKNFFNNNKKYKVPKKNKNKTINKGQLYNLYEKYFSKEITASELEEGLRNL